MDTRCRDLGYIAGEHTATDINDFESFYNSTLSEVNKVSTVSSSRNTGENQLPTKDLMDYRGFSTGVSVEESDFLEEFMACDFSNRSNMGSLSDINVTSSLSELDNLPRSSESQYINTSGHQVSGVTSFNSDQVSHATMSTGYKYPSYHNEQENRFPGTRRILSTYGSNHHQNGVGSKSLKIMKQKGGNSNETVGGSLLRQQLQGSLCSNKYRKAQETVCRECNKPFTAKCLLKNCRKSDEVLCPDCGMELTAKCLLKSCSGS